MSGERVLIVDDHAPIVRLLHLLLAAEGYEIATVGDGAEALPRAFATPPAVVLLDWMVPNLDGFEFCRRLHEEPATAHTQIVLLSGRHDVAALADRAGAHSHLAKPFDLDDLLQKVASAAAASKALQGDISPFARMGGESS